MKNLETLGSLWKRGLKPKDLVIHYYLFWVIRAGGNVIRAAKKLGIHRNTIQLHFHTWKISNQTVAIRKAAKKMFDLGYPWMLVMSRIYNGFLKAPHRMETSVHGKLINLWKEGFSLKSLDAHYIVTARRQGHEFREIEYMLNLSSRHVRRLVAAAVDRKTLPGKQLAGMRIKMSEVYSKRYLKQVKRKVGK